jgi:hypothetical protein
MGLVLGTSNFTQYEKDFFVTEALTDLDSVQNNILYVAEGVKNDQYTLPVLGATPQFSTFTAIPVAVGTTNLSNKNIPLGKMQGYEEFDPNIFENHWHKDELTNLLMQRKLPKTFLNYMGVFYTKKLMVQLERGIHLGSLGYTSATTGTAGAPGVNYSIKYFDGIIRQALTLGGTLQVASPSAITSANIIAKMEAAKNLLPKALLADPARYNKLKYCMSVEDAQLYEEALVNTSFKNQNTTERGLNQYKGYEIVILSGIPKDTFYFCEATSDVTSNLHMPVTSIENMTFKIDKLQSNAEVYFYKMIIKAGVSIIKPNEFAIHTTLTTASFTA